MTVAHSGTKITIQGTAYDPDTTAPIKVEYRFDWGTWNPLMASLSAPVAAVPGPHGYSVSITSTYATHHVCVVLFNVLAGSSLTYLPCATVVLVAPLTVNQQIAAYAKTFVGKYRYTSGGQTPTAGFDCSGLTLYIYHHYNGSAAASVDISYEGRGSSGRMLLCRRGIRRSSSVMSSPSLVVVI